MSDRLTFDELPTYQVMVHRAIMDHIGNEGALRLIKRSLDCMTARTHYSRYRAINDTGEMMDIVIYLDAPENLIALISTDVMRENRERFESKRLDWILDDANMRARI